VGVPKMGVLLRLGNTEMMNWKRNLCGTVVNAICALSVASIYGPESSAAADESTAAPSSTVRDGSHDFDFIYGKWKMPNHRLKHDWEDFITCDEGNPLPGGVGNIDYWKTSYWKDFVGVTVRTYDRKTGLWRLYWVDNTFSQGIIQPPVVGKFKGNVGIFEGPDTRNGQPIVVRFTWTLSPKGVSPAEKWEQMLNPKAAPIIAKWNQAFSTDGGKTWEINWYNEFYHDGNCTPTS
jgi:hypothetical protein